MLWCMYDIVLWRGSQDPQGFVINGGMYVGEEVKVKAQEEEVRYWDVESDEARKAGETETGRWMMI